MTNREWLESLSDEDKLDFWSDNYHNCNICVYSRLDNCMTKDCDCNEGHRKWFEEEHKPMKGLTVRQ